MTDPKDIIIRVTDTEGLEMSITVSWDATLDEWKPVFKTILTFLEYGVPEGEYEREDF